MGHSPRHAIHNFKRFEIMQRIFSDHHEIKLQFNNRNITGKSLNTGKLSNMLLCNLSVKVEVAEEIRKYFKLNKMKIQHIKTCGVHLKQSFNGNL